MLLAVAILRGVLVAHLREFILLEGAVVLFQAQIVLAKLTLEGVLKLSFPLRLLFGLWEAQLRLIRLWWLLTLLLVLLTWLESWSHIFGLLGVESLLYIISVQRINEAGSCFVTAWAVLTKHGQTAFVSEADESTTAA